MEIYMSELERLRKSGKGSFWGLWTHAGKAIAHVAVSDGDSKLLSYCQQRKLEKVGEYQGEYGMINSVRCPLDVTPPLTYVVAVVPQNKEPKFFKVNTEGTPVELNVCFFPKLSPYRYDFEPKLHTDSNGSIIQSYVRPISSSEGFSLQHWSSFPKNLKFLQDLTAKLQSEDLVVKQLRQPGSSYLVLSIQDKLSDKRVAIGFPDTFATDRKVTVCAGTEPSCPALLQSQAKKAMNTILSISNLRPSHSMLGIGTSERVKKSKAQGNKTRKKSSEKRPSRRNAVWEET